ncbi:MAG: metal-dependent hydrolase [Candidatus Lokiarchaeota archaeon]|nr:metal-dependent hydrolase [Candidatus Lokiarchaeota archaeon]
MNGVTHLVTGYFLARLFRPGKGAERYRHDSFPAVFTAIAATLPDIDSSIGIPHAQATHTILGALALAFVFTGVVFAMGSPFLREARLSFVQLLVLAVAGVSSHLFLDVFTYYGGTCVGSPAHVYFWPLWNQSFHLDCIIDATPPVYAARVLVEWAFYSPFLLVLLVDRGIKHKENPFAMLYPASWLRGTADPEFTSRPRPVKASLVLLGIVCAAVVVLQVAGIVFVDLAGLL